MPGVIQGVRGAHLAAHGHHEPALTYLDQAVEAERSRTVLARDQDYVRLLSLCDWLERRADSLRALGREEEAKRDTEEAEKCRLEATRD